MKVARGRWVSNDPEQLNLGPLWSLVPPISFGRQIATTLAGEPIRYPYKISWSHSAKVAFMVLGILLFVSGIPRAHAGDDTPPGIIPCARVFVTGDQLYAVQWANKNLFKSACMAPQPTAATATYVLELRSDPALVRGGLTSGTVPVAPDNFSVNCYSIGVSTTCKDSSGAAYTTTCHAGRFGVECDTYNGVGVAEALVMLPFQILLRNSARAYLFDATTNELVWKYDGDRPWDRDFAYAGQCVKEKRAGVWGVADSQKSRCIESKLPIQLLEPVAVEPPASPGPAPQQGESAPDRAKKAQEHADCLKLALDNPQITCSQ